MTDKTFGGRSIRLNIASSLLVQVANYLFPLALLPFLARVFGAAAFGDYILAVSVIMYAAVVVEWGFSIGGTRHVARERLGTQSLHLVFWDTLVARALLASLISVFLLGSLFFVSSKLSWLLVAGIVHLFGTAINPDWYLVGLERGTRLSIATLVGRSAQLILTLVVVKTTDQVWCAVLIWGGATLLTSLTAITTMSQILPWQIPGLSFSRSIRLIVNGRYFFLVKSSVLLYAGGGTIVVGLFSGPLAAGIYGGADRLSRAGLSFVGQVGNAVLPRISALAAHSPDTMPRFVQRAAAVQLTLAMMGSVVLLVAAKPIVVIMLGQGFDRSIDVLRLLSPLPLLVVLGSVLGMQVMVPLGLEKELLYITLLGLCLFLILGSLLSLLLGAQGAAIAIVVTEIVVAVLQGTMIRARRREMWSRLTSFG